MSLCTRGSFQISKEVKVGKTSKGGEIIYIIITQTIKPPPHPN